MRKLIYLLAVLGALPASADTEYLKPFLGRFQITSRVCDTTDPICNSATGLELARDEAQNLVLREFDGSTVLNELRMTEQDSGNVRSYFAGEEEPPMEAGWWTLLRGDHMELVSFEHDTTVSGLPVSFSYETDDRSPARKTSIRKYVLKALNQTR